MPHVVTEGCVLCKYTDCVAVCPVVCFHEALEFLVIDPHECIDCGMCVSACPTEAIYSVAELPSNLSDAISLNEQLAKSLPVILDSQPPLPDADQWNGVTGKADLMQLPPSKANLDVAGDCGRSHLGLS